MNREIKFRAWSHGVKSENMWAKRKFGEWLYPPQMMYDEKPGDCLVWKSQGQNIEIMQYTGLKDKNGTEIYEGDIVRRTYTVNRTALRKVVYHQDGFHLEEMEKFKGLSLLASALDMIEVIGNIFENSDLLSESK